MTAAAGSNAIYVAEREITDADWLDAVQAALRTPLPPTDRVELIRELLAAKRTRDGRMPIFHHPV